MRSGVIRRQERGRLIPEKKTENYFTGHQIFFLILTQIVFEIIPPVLHDTRHDNSRQNVPIKNDVHISRKKSFGFPADVMEW